MSLIWSWPRVMQEAVPVSGKRLQPTTVASGNLQVKAWLLKSMQCLTGDLMQMSHWSLIQGTLTSCRCTQGASLRLKKHHKMFSDKGAQQRHSNRWVGEMDGALRLHLLCSCQSKTKATERQSVATILFLYHKHNFYLTHLIWSIFFVF